MTVSSVKTGEVGLSFALNNNYMEPIATTLVGSGGVNQVTFNDIPQTYKHLQLRCSALTTTGGKVMVMKLNSDNGSNYTSHILQGNGSAASAAGFTGNSFARFFGLGHGTSTTNPAGSIVDLLDYTNTSKNKTLRALSGSDFNGSGEVTLESALWLNTNAISSIQIVTNDGTNYAQYSRFSLYGIKG